MPPGIQNWSKTAASNGNTDSSVNWLEGQAPSTVNDSARAMMARIKEWHDDLGGITTGGTSTAYTVTTNRVFTSAALMDKAIITLIPHTTSGAAPTLAVDGLTARQIRSATGVNLLTGALTASTPYTLIYLNATTEFIVIGGLTNVQGTPIGQVADFAGSTAPAGWVLCFGQAVSRTTYAALFSVIGTAFGIGDGATTFNLPDCQGRVTAGKDNMSGASANRLTNQSGGLDGDVLGATGGVETHTLTTAQLPVVTPAGSVGITDPEHFHYEFNTDSVVSAGSDLSNTTFAVTDGQTNGLPDYAYRIKGTATTPTIGKSESKATGITANFTGTSFGSGNAHNNVQPTIVFNKIIFAGV
jgi:microcystin-dependent protein